MSRPRIAVLAVVVIVAACRPMPASVASDTPVVASAPASTPEPVARDRADVMAPTVIPGLRRVDAIDGTIVLGRDADDATVLYDLANGRATRLDVGVGGWRGDLGGGFAVGAGSVDEGADGSPFIYDIASGVLKTIDLAHGVGGSGRVATDGHLVVGTRALTNGNVQAAWVYHIDSGKLDRLDFLEGRTRGGIAGVSGTRMAGTFGADDDDQAWLYDFETGVETKLHPLFGGALSWVDGIDGDLVVGGIQTPKPWVNQAVVYDVASGTVTNLSAEVGESKALGVDGPTVVGGGDQGAFAYDHRTGEVRILPGGNVALAVSGDLVVGMAGESVVVWDLAPTP